MTSRSLPYFEIVIRERATGRRVDGIVQCPDLWRRDDDARTWWQVAGRILDSYSRDYRVSIHVRG